MLQSGIEKGAVAAGKQVLATAQDGVRGAGESVNKVVTWPKRMLDNYRHKLEGVVHEAWDRIQQLILHAYAFAGLVIFSLILLLTRVSSLRGAAAPAVLV